MKNRNTEIIFTQQFQESFAKLKGQAGKIGINVAHSTGSTGWQELGSKKLPETLEDLKAKVLKVMPMSVTKVTFTAAYQ